jgi:clan AA aspartic protease (TIGR02281 family)
MRRRLCGVALAIGVVLLDPTEGVPEPANDHDDVRLERLTAAAMPEMGGPARRDVRAIGHDIPLSGDRKHLIVDGTLNGIVTGPMLVDTGASYCVLTRGTARKLGLATRAHGTIPVATANGQVDADFVELTAVELRDARLAGVDAVVMDAVEPPLIGIIGLNFLTRFRFSVDLAEGTLRLEP